MLFVGSLAVVQEGVSSAPSMARRRPTSSSAWKATVPKQPEFPSVAEFHRQRDNEWLSGHSPQGQTVFPGAGYVVMAMEAAISVASSSDKEIQLLEVLDLEINKAVTFHDDDRMVELSLSLSCDSSQTTDTYATYQFVIILAWPEKTRLSSSGSSTVAVTYGPGSSDTLPARQEDSPHLNNVSIDRFYNMLSELGYGYTKEFRSVSILKRGDSKARGAFDFHRLEDNDRKLVMHPATLDVAFRSFIGAYTARGDRRLRSLLVRYPPASLV